MKNSTLAVILATTIAASSLTVVVPAVAADAFSFSFNTGDVAFAYSDGYWDHNHQWHKWHNAREAREYRTRYAEHYNAMAHTRAPGQGWRDDDHDGVPNALDKHPENPRRN